jgi:hypothetical protein
LRTRFLVGTSEIVREPLEDGGLRRQCCAGRQPEPDRGGDTRVHVTLDEARVVPGGARLQDRQEARVWDRCGRTCP